MDLSADQFEMMLKMPIKNKRALLAERLRRDQDANRPKRVESTPQLNAQALQATDISSIDELRRLRVELSFVSQQWIRQFVEMGGAESLVKIMNNLHDKADRKKRGVPIPAMMEECIRCLNYLMRDESITQQIVEAQGATRAIVLALRYAPCQKNATKDSKILSTSATITLVRIVCLMCIVPGLHSKIIDELFRIRENQKKKNRFHGLVSRLTDSTVGLDLRVEYLTLVNALVNAPEDVWTRSDMRSQLTDAGITNSIRILKDHPPSSAYAELDIQISVYEDESSTDGKQLQRKRKSGVFVPVGITFGATQAPTEKSAVDTHALLAQIVHESTQRSQNAFLMPILSELLRVLQSGSSLESLSFGGLLAGMGGFGPGLGPGMGGGPGFGPGLGGGPGFGPGLGGGPGFGPGSGGGGIGGGGGPGDGPGAGGPGAPKPPEPPKPEEPKTDDDAGPPPPPPPGVPPPPPPPPPGGKKKTVVPPPIAYPEPKCKLRPLHWTKVAPDNVKNTVFEDIGRGVTAASLKIEFDELENLFKVVPLGKKGEGSESKAKAQAKGKIQLLTQKTSQNLCPSLSFHPLSNYLTPFPPLYSHFLVKVQEVDSRRHSQSDRDVGSKHAGCGLSAPADSFQLSNSTRRRAHASEGVYSCRRIRI
jgi:hypothetical protein